MTESNQYQNYPNNPYRQNSEGQSQSPSQPANSSPYASAGYGQSGPYNYAQGGYAGPQYVGSPRGGVISRMLKSSVFITLVLVAVAGVLGVFLSSFFTGNSGSGDSVPVIEAQHAAYKHRPSPEQMGGTIQDDSQIYDAVSENEYGQGADRYADRVQVSESAEDMVKQIVSKERIKNSGTFYDRVAKEPSQGDLEDVSQAPEPIEAATEERAERVAKNLLDPSQLDPAQKDTSPATPVGNTAQRLSGNDAALAKDMSRMAEARTSAEQNRPEHLHSAGSSPNTIAFVRSVLDKKEDQVESGSVAQQQAKTMNGVEPASGAPSINAMAAVPAPSHRQVTPGSYYIQLGSVRSEDGAHSEWKKFTKKYSGILDDVSYRVQFADLKEKGAFYRVQAGPMSKDSAADLCSQIKAKAPGGCLVTK